MHNQSRLDFLRQYMDPAHVTMEKTLLAKNLELFITVARTALFSFT